MKKLVLLLIFLICAFTAVLSQDVGIARIIAMNGDVSIDGVAVQPGRIISTKDVTIAVGKNNSYATILSNDGHVKTFTLNQVNVRGLLKLMQPINPIYRSHNVAGDVIVFLGFDRYQHQTIMHDSIFLHWKTRLLPPFTIRVSNLYGDELNSESTIRDSVYIPLGEFFAEEKSLIIGISNHQQSEFIVKKISIEALAAINRELTQVTGSVSDRKVIRLALLKKNELHLDLLFEKSLLTQDDIDALSIDTKNFLQLLNNENYPVIDVRR